MNEFDSAVRDAIGGLLDLAPKPPAPGNLRQSSLDQQRSHRTIGAVVVGAVLIAIVVVGVTLFRTRDIADDMRVLNSAPATSTSLETSAVPTEPTPVTEPDPLVGTTGWYLPGYIPDGYSIVTLTGDLGNRAPLFGRRWVQLDPATGSVVASIVVRAVPVTTDKPYGKPTPGLFIHGQPAKKIVEDDGRIVISWQEGNTGITVQFTDVSEDATIAAAQAVAVDPSAVDATYPPGAIPAGFSVPTADGSAPHGAVTSGFDLQPDTYNGFDDIAVGISPNYDGQTIQNFDGNGWEPDLAGSIDVRVKTLGTDGHGTLRAVVWFDNGMQLSVSARLDLDELFTFIEGLQPASPAAIVDAGRAITARTLTLPALDQATLDDGTLLSVRTDGHGATAICVEAPIALCQRNISESTLVGDTQTYVLGAFKIAGTDTVVGWHDSSTGPPKLGPSNLIGTSGAESTAVIGAIAPTAHGEFFTVAIPPGESPPSFDFGSATSPGPVVSVNPPSLISY